MVIPVSVADSAIEYGLQYTNNSGYTPKTFLLNEWPESQRIMNHPKAKLIDENFNEVQCYIVPFKIWEQYKNTYYDHVPEWNADRGNTDDEFDEK